jgi:hypothetical protein
VVCPDVYPTADTLQSLDRSVKPAALLFQLLDNLVNVHAGMLTLGTSGHGLPFHHSGRTAPAFTCHVRSGRGPSIELPLPTSEFPRQQTTSIELHFVPCCFSFPGPHPNLKFAHNAANLHVPPPVERVALCKTTVNKAERSQQDAIVTNGRFGDKDYAGLDSFQGVLAIVPEVRIERQ